MIRYTEVGIEKNHRLKQFLRFLLSFTSINRRQNYKRIQNYRRLRERNTILNRKRKFDIFLRDHISISEPYLSYDQLLAKPPKADIYIVGSDQVWNIDLDNPVARAWFLKFGNPETKRLSYAASLGRKLSPNEIPIFKELLSDFEAIGVREIDGLSLCQALGFVNCQLVLDPTLLLDAPYYTGLIEGSKINALEKQPYLFLYYLNIETCEELGWNDIDIYIKKRGLELVSVSSSGYYPAKEIIPNVKNNLLTIEEWIESVQNAEFVVTNSFHGVVFSIIFHRPFIAILLHNQYCGGNNRILSLLKSLQLESRILYDSHDISFMADLPIDWNEVDNRLNKLRVDSKAFLNDNLC